MSTSFNLYTEKASNAIRFRDLATLERVVHDAIKDGKPVSMSSMISMVTRDLLMLLTTKPDVAERQNHFHWKALHYLADLKAIHRDAYHDNAVSWISVNGTLTHYILNQPADYKNIHYPFELLIRFFPDYDINVSNYTGGVNLLMASLSNGFIASSEVKALLDLGADVHWLSESNGRPIHCLNLSDLHTATKKLQILLESGANPYEEITYTSLNPNGMKGTTYASFMHQVKLHKSLVDSIPEFADQFEKFVQLIHQYKSASVALNATQELSATRTRSGI